MTSKAVTAWLFAVCGLIILMVVLGGYVRLTRSGLSIVEWNPVSGVIPPLSDQAWQEEFAKYQQTPEFQQVNAGMTLAGYKRIFYVEYIHRLLARLAGLAVLTPLLYFLWRRIIPRRRAMPYVLIVALFALQGFLGWYMVSSGLEDLPRVSHFRLTIHLMLALFLLAFTLWLALRHHYHFPRRPPGAFRSRSFLLAAAMGVVLVVQIAYGGFVAGLKAGYVSNSWPLIFGRLIPAGMVEQLTPWWLNLLEAPVTVHFIHRWLAFGVLLMAGVLYYATRHRPLAPTIHRAIWILLGLVGLQIGLGISVVLFSVPLVLALSHQALALFLFIVVVFINFLVIHEHVPDTPLALADMPAAT